MACSRRVGDLFFCRRWWIKPWNSDKLVAGVGVGWGGEGVWVEGGGFWVFGILVAGEQEGKWVNLMLMF